MANCSSASSGWVPNWPLARTMSWFGVLNKRRTYWNWPSHEKKLPSRSVSLRSVASRTSNPMLKVDRSAST